MRERTTRVVQRHGALLFGIGCIGLGVCLDEWIRYGWAPFALGAAVLFSKWVFGIIGRTFFDDEIHAVTDYLGIDADPVKAIIWRVHHAEHHPARFRDCLHEICAPFK